MSVELAWFLFFVVCIVGAFWLGVDIGKTTERSRQFSRAVWREHERIMLGRERAPDFVPHDWNDEGVA